ncbi:MAG: hypothetical protein ACRC28_04075 [Clostridium sp.]|uniref:hypothetical protein n=1 Tax=Clostridium sp. TaxID=1506 RepID=UPI003F349D69
MEDKNPQVVSELATSDIEIRFQVLDPLTRETTKPKELTPNDPNPSPNKPSPFEPEISSPPPIVQTSMSYVPRTPQELYERNCRSSWMDQIVIEPSYWGSKAHIAALENSKKEKERRNKEEYILDIGRKWNKQLDEKKLERKQLLQEGNFICVYPPLE